MCGIAGFFSTDPSSRMAKAYGVFLERAARMLSHRGPDETASILRDIPGGLAGLAQARLAIIDLTRGLYPIANEDGSVRLVVNGEIYNSPELRRDLEGRGHRFNTNTDTEVLVHLYEEKGHRLVDSLEGMFAFAILDERQGRLVLGRDRMGQKPLYLCRNEGTLFFASELRPLALLALEGKPAFDEEAFLCYLRLGYVAGRKSIVKGVERLLPAEVAVFDVGSEERLIYYEPTFKPQEKLMAQALEETEQALNGAVRRRLMSERPLGLFLSRGIDSGLVGSVVAGVSEDIRAFTAGPDNPLFDERLQAGRVAERLGLPWVPLHVPFPETGLLDELAWAVDEPMADSSFLPTYLLCRAARGEIVVALSGDGGDEFFGGYERFGAGLLALGLRYFRLPARAAAGLMEAVAPGRARRARRFLDAVSRARGGTRREALGRLYEGIVSISRPDALADVTGEDKRIFEKSGPVAGAVADAPAPSHLDALCWADLHTYLPYDILHKVDRASMSHGLEVRSPFLDLEVQRVALSLQPGYKVGGRLEVLAGRGGKKILRRLYARRVGEGAWRRKRGFGVPVADWLRRDAGDFVERLFKEGSALAAEGLVREEGVLAVLREHHTGRDHGYLLWALAMAELWLRRALKERATNSG